MSSFVYKTKMQKYTKADGTVSEYPVRYKYKYTKKEKPADQPKLNNEQVKKLHAINALVKANVDTFTMEKLEELQQYVNQMINESE